MDMYQKREMRKNKEMYEDKKSFPSVGINWDSGANRKLLKFIEK